MYTFAIEQRASGLLGVTYNREETLRSGLITSTQLAVSVLLRRTTQTGTGLLVPGFDHSRLRDPSYVPPDSMRGESFGDIREFVASAPKKIIDKVGPSPNFYPQPEFVALPDGDSLVAALTERDAINDVHRALLGSSALNSYLDDDNKGTGYYL